MGKPRIWCALLRNTSRLLASRRVCVATARICSRRKPARRSLKRARQSQPRCIASRERLLLSSRPLPWRTVSLRYSTRWIWPCSYLPISRRKLLEPRSSAARRVPLRMMESQGKETVLFFIIGLLRSVTAKKRSYCTQCLPNAKLSRKCHDEFLKFPLPRVSLLQGVWPEELYSPVFKDIS